jgi:glycosyltransferase involved in cell wall biosynthesis
MSLIKPKLLIVSHTPLVAHFFLRSHIVDFSRNFDVYVAHNTNIDSYCPNITDICNVKNISIQRRFGFMYDFFALFQLARLTCRLNPVIVISVAPKPGLLGMMISALLGVKVRVHIFQGEVWPNRKGISRLILKSCDAFIIKSATHLLCVSPSEKKLLENNFFFESNKLRVLGNGTICGVKSKFLTFDRDLSFRDRHRHGLKEDSRVCVYLGRICYEKGVRDLIIAFSRIDHDCRNVQLLLVGPEEDFSVQHEISNLPVHIKEKILHVGFTEVPEKLLASADFLCLPSYREGFGLSILEAAAIGLPAVGSRIVGICDAILDNETGLLFTPRNIQDLSSCLCRMFDDDNLRKQLGQNAQSRVIKNFNHYQVVSFYTRYIENLYKNHYGFQQIK